MCHRPVHPRSPLPVPRGPRARSTRAAAVKVRGKERSKASSEGGDNGSGSSSGGSSSGGGGGGGGGGSGDSDASGGADADATWRADYGRADVKHGKFSEAEKEVLAKAVADYAAKYGCSTSDYAWLLQRGGEGRRGGRVRGGAVTPVAAVAAALPQRTRKAVFAALQRMFAEGRGKVRGRCGLQLGPRQRLGNWRVARRPRGDCFPRPRRAAMRTASTKRQRSTQQQPTRAPSQPPPAPAPTPTPARPRPRRSRSAPPLTPGPLDARGGQAAPQRGGRQGPALEGHRRGRRALGRAVPRPVAQDRAWRRAQDGCEQRGKGRGARPGACGSPGAATPRGGNARVVGAPPHLSR
jgi:hypothetical protein